MTTTNDIMLAEHEPLLFKEKTLQGFIADLFSRLNKVERLGSGIRKMRKAMADAGLPEPEFDPNGFFTALFRRSPEFALKQPETAQKTIQKTTLKTAQKIMALKAPG